jgi:uncharacterized OB-fold protein
VKVVELHPQTGDLPHADPSPVTAPFWEAGARGELLFQRCEACGTPAFPPTTHCRECLSDQLSWERSEGRGSLYSWTIVHRPVTPAFTAPYAPAIVTLAEGYQMVTNIVGTTSDQLRLDLPVRVAFHPVGGDLYSYRPSGGDLYLPYFEPA